MSLASALGGILGSWLIRHWGSAFLMQACGAASLALIFLFLALLKRAGQDRPAPEGGRAASGGANPAGDKRLRP
jgi:uncharacterized membrane protein YfcA